MKHWLIPLAMPFLAACGGGAMPLDGPRNYTGPQQVIYRIDQDRYVTFENYEKCPFEGIMKWHDERRNLHVEMSPVRGSMNRIWPGRFSIAPGEERLAVPTFWCGDIHCHAWIVFSNDGGRHWGQFSAANYSRHTLYYSLGKPDADALGLINTDVRVTADGLIYVIPAHRQFMYRYRLDGTRQQKPASTQLSDKIPWLENFDGRMKPLGQGGEYLESPYDPRNVAAAPEIRTPSGQDHFSCDASLNPVPNKDGSE